MHTASRVEGTVGATGLPKAMSGWLFSVPGYRAWEEEKERDTVMNAKVCNLEERGECSDIDRVLFKGVPVLGIRIIQDNQGTSHRPIANKT